MDKQEFQNLLVEVSENVHDNPMFIRVNDIKSLEIHHDEDGYFIMINTLDGHHSIKGSFTTEGDARQWIERSWKILKVG